MTDPGASPLQPGRTAPLGAQVRDGGVNFAFWSGHAERIELCLFDAEGSVEQARLPLHGPEDGVFHGFLPDATPGQVYGLRVHGPWAPGRGHCFDAGTVLLDPWARAIVGDPATGLRARVAAPAAAPAAPRPRIAPADRVLYELHVKGFTRQLPGVPPAIRGTFAGLAHPAAIAHVKALGVTTLSLLPVHQWLDEPHLTARGLTNYWGYNTLGFFCATPRLAADTARANDEFRAMVDPLHAHDLEVVLDVVYNHTAEGGDGGPALSFRGLDNASWYRLQPGHPEHNENLTGCGNTVNVAHPRVTQFVLDSLRFWVMEMGVDGFRFDLAPVLGRRADGCFDPHAAFFTALHQDPVLAEALLIAEPWDAAADGYQLGRFPARWLEWNDRFRDAVRGYWLGAGVGRGELAQRFAGSSDLFQRAGRPPLASVNFVSVHDGFTLADVVSHARKHNHANGEDNRDGRDNELCANFGVEGATGDAVVLARRARVQRAMLATLLLAQGTPMLCAGDEFGNSQQGNNNAYCQDNPTGWLDWPHADEALLAFAQRLLALRREEPLLRHPRWFGDTPGEPRLRWWSPEGRELHAADWQGHRPQPLAAWLTAGPGAAGVLIAFNPGLEPLAWRLPPGPWQALLCTDLAGACTLSGDAATVPAESLAVLRAAPLS